MLAASGLNRPICSTFESGYGSIFATSGAKVMPSTDGAERPASLKPFCTSRSSMRFMKAAASSAWGPFFTRTMQLCPANAPSFGKAMSTGAPLAV